MSVRNSMWRRVILGASAPLAAAITIGTAIPAGASPAAAPAPAGRGSDSSTGSGIKATTPFCIVQGAVMYPLFIGMTMLLNPTSITTAPSEYWNGSKQSTGRLKTCGI